MEILDAALEEFALRGFAATRVEDIARRADITKGLVYSYFPSKEDLFLAVLKEMKGPVFDKVIKAGLAPTGSAVTLLEALFGFFAEQVVHNRRGREATRLMFAEGGRFPDVVDRWHADVLAPALESFRMIIQYGVERGEFRPDTLDSMPHLLASTVLYAVHWKNAFGERHPFDSDHLLDDALQFILRALKPTDSSSKKRPTKLVRA